jgi:hypothetical protein
VGLIRCLGGEARWTDVEPIVPMAVVLEAMRVECPAMMQPCLALL